MAKKASKKDCLDAWREAESAYRSIADALAGTDPSDVDKSLAVSVTKARAKADRRLADYLDRCLG